MVEMKTVTIDGTTFEIVDKKARQEKLDATALPTAINNALAQAKASGEFNGKDGADGKTPVKGTDYWTDDDKAEIVEAVKDAGGGSGGLSITDDGNGNVTITSSGSVSITDDGNGNVVIA